jgi:hypothetical protein
MYSRPNAPRTIGGVLDDAVRLYRASFSRCWVLALILSVASGAFGVYEALQVHSANSTPTAPGLQGLVTTLTRLGQMQSGHHIWLWNLLATLIWLVLQTALIARQDAVASDREDTLGSAVVFALRRLPRLIVAGIAFGVAVVVGFVFLIIPAIWLWGQLQLWIPVLVAEDVGAFRALGRSWTLVERNWWRSSTTIGVAAIVIAVLSLAGGLPTGLILLARPDPATTLLLSQIVAVALRVFTAPMLTAVLVAIYHDLRLRRDGGDLAARVGTLQPV